MAAFLFRVDASLGCRLQQLGPLPLPRRLALRGLGGGLGERRLQRSLPGVPVRSFVGPRLFECRQFACPSLSRLVEVLTRALGSRAGGEQIGFDPPDLVLKVRVRVFECGSCLVTFLLQSYAAFKF